MKKQQYKHKGEKQSACTVSYMASVMYCRHDTVFVLMWKCSWTSHIRHTVKL